MAAELLVGVGVAVAKLLLRAADLNDSADALGDAREGWSRLQHVRARKHQDAIGEVIADRLRAQLPATTDKDARGDLTAAARDVADLLSRLADDDRAVVAACTHPDQFLTYAKRHGGHRLQRWTSERATPLFDQVLNAAAAEFASLAPSSPRFVAAGLVDVLGALEAIEDANTRRHTELVERLDHISAQPTGGTDVVWASLQAPVSTSPVIALWDPADLGVHDSIVVDGTAGLTPYIPRDHDKRLRDALARLKDPGAGPVMVTVFGTSCTGKTRSLYEAVKAVLPTWPVLRPIDTHDLHRMLQEGVPRGSVVWLDELQKYLTNQGVTAAQGIHHLIEAGGAERIAFVATIWTTNLRVMEQRPDPAGAAAGIDAIRDLLEATAADQCFVRDTLTPNELAGRNDTDARNTDAVRATQDGEVIQVLAGGTQLVHRMYPTDRPPGTMGASPFSPAARAVILAAAELRRVGYLNPIPGWAIQDAAPSYLDPAHRRRHNPAVWFERAFTEAIKDAADHGDRSLDIHYRGVPALTPLWLVDDAGETAEYYDLHDYLLQDHLARHQFEPTKDELWETLTRPDNLPRIDKATSVRLAVDANGRGLYRACVALVRTGADDGDPESREHLAVWLAERGDEEAITELRTRADRGDEKAQRHLAVWLAERGDEEAITELRTRADRGDEKAQAELADWFGAMSEEEIDDFLQEMANELATRRPYAVLIERGDGSYWFVEPELADRLEHGDNDAITEMRTRAKEGDELVQGMFAGWLGHLGDEEAIAELRVLADGGDGQANDELVNWLVKSSDEEAIAELRMRASGGGFRARKALVVWLVQRGDREAIAELRTLVHAQYPDAFESLMRIYERTDRGTVELDVNALPVTGRRGVSEEESGTDKPEPLN